MKANTVLIFSGSFNRTDFSGEKKSYPPNLLAAVLFPKIQGDLMSYPKGHCLIHPKTEDIKCFDVTKILGDSLTKNTLGFSFIDCEFSR